MALRMAQPWSHPKTRVFWFRRVVPKDLRGLVGKREELASLDTKDPAVARVRHARVAAEVEARWANFRNGRRTLTEREAHKLATVVHDVWISWHSDEPSLQVRWHPTLYAELWTRLVPARSDRPEGADLPINDVLLTGMRQLCREQADNILSHHGFVVDADSHHKLALAVGAAFQRSSLTLKQAAQGEIAIDDFQSGRGSVSVDDGAHLQSPQSLPLAHPPPKVKNGRALKLTELCEAWWEEAHAAGRKPSTHESYRNTIKSLVAFLKHDDATRVSPTDIVAYKDHRLTSPSSRTGKVPSAKTVKDSDLAALRTLFSWAVSNHKLPANPAAGLTIKLGKKARLRTKGFTDDEATALLAAALRYSNDQERPCTAAAKHWVPWLCAFTGARVGEMAQLRRQDVQQRSEGWIVHITPDAGTQKTNEARSVPIHPQLIELGFPVFVQGCPDGHLFLTPAPNGDVLGPLQAVKNRLAEFGRSIVSDINVAPNHGWRHRFKTVGMEAGISSRVLDAIQGQAARTVADTYGDVTLRTMAVAISKFPSIDVSRPALEGSPGRGMTTDDGQAVRSTTPHS